MLRELLASSCTPSFLTCSNCGGAKLHYSGAVPRWRRCIPDGKRRVVAYLISSNALERMRKYRGMEEMGDQDPGCGGIKRKKQRVPFQIFPDPAELILGPEACLNSLDHCRTKERLPSIVVEPTEVSEVESGELRWPPEDIETEDEEEDLFLEQCIPPPNIADWEKDEEEEEKTTIILNQQPGLTLIDLQSDAFRDDTPTLPPSSAPSFI